MVRKLQQRRGWGFAFAAGLLKPTLFKAARRDWHDGEKIPASGGCVLVVNHISHIDPLFLAHFIYDHGRLPRILAKDALWKVGPLKPLLESTRTIPVARLSADAQDAYAAAVRALKDGELVVMYVEGSITRDPDGWPMRGKSGAARLALASDCPVIPVGQWGAHEVLPAYSKKPHFFPRRTVRFKAGDPVDLGDLRGRELTAGVLREATDRIMAAITCLVEDLRGEKAPPERFDPARAGVAAIGNPHKSDKKKRRR